MSVPPSPATPARSPATPGSRRGGGVGADVGNGTQKSALASISLGRMERLELENFKSYEGLHSIPFVQFSAGQTKRREEKRREDERREEKSEEEGRKGRAGIAEQAQRRQ
jgi:hypothetical protein